MVEHDAGAADDDSGTKNDRRDDEARLATAKPLAGKSVGHTSVVFKLKLEGGLEAAFKPRSKRGGARYTGEIAAYRLARALGLANVPAAYARTFDASDLRAAFASSSKPAGTLFDDEAVVTTDGRIAGAVIPWLAHFELLPLEAAAWRSRVRGWLSRGAKPAEADRAMASQISTMILFDYLTANWDRWSGGNIALDRASSTVLFIDNDGAFFEPPPAVQTATQLGIVRETWSLSRAFVAALRGLDDATLETALGDEAPGVPLLTPKQRAAVSKRRGTLLRIVDEKVKAAGESSVLAFD